MTNDSYLVTGIPVTRDRGKSVDDRLHTGKPFYGVNGLALYDNNVRFYSPIDGRFTTIDPLCEKYPETSPYVHCNNNPLSIIDPTGMDIWELNNKGEIISRIEDKTEDAFYMVEKNKKGNYERIYTLDNNGEKKYKYISFDYGTIENQNVLSGKDGLYSLFQVRGDDKGTQLFEFMSDNITGSKTEVEISHIKAGEKGDLGLNFVITSHKNGEESGMPNFIQAQLKHGYTLRELNHSHAKNSQASFGNKAGDDLQFKASVLFTYPKDNTLKFKIYHVPTKKYLKY